ncbi:5-formyltetrahydrofolate cyclo-ligase [Bradymonadaceae bacterium TMQ3]|nr:5-formyltetrahydrofolate cyclo-ligase [Bradymonadaceae bacterium TMQ3]TXC76850.1 5-formyltetrahydrofolate cyclo-ligase [Bradymonadales bacterium TMQ1]
MSPADARRLQKTRLRNELRARRRALDVPLRQHAAEALRARLMAVPHFFAARHIAAYWAHGAELSVAGALYEKVSQGAQVYLPRVNASDRLDFVDAGGLDGLQPGAFGIMEPEGPACDLSRIEIFLVPGLGFDRRGHRLGSGRAYYDRALAGVTHALLIGVGYDWQLIDEELPEEAHDRPMDIIATPKRWHVPAQASSLHTSKE